MFRIRKQYNEAKVDQVNYWFLKEIVNKNHRKFLIR